MIPEIRGEGGGSKHGLIPCKLIGDLADRKWAATISLFPVPQPADKSPSAAEFADGEHQFIFAFLQWEVDSIVFRVSDACAPGAG